MLIFVWIKGYEYVPQKGLIISLICLASVFSAMFFVEKTERIRLGAAILLAAVTLETGANCYLSMSRLIYESTHTRVHDIYNFTDSTTEPVNYIKNLDDGFYRMEKTFQRTMNDSMFYAFNGTGHYSSTKDVPSMNLLGKMGLRSRDQWTYFNQGTSSEAESLLGIKYLISGHDMSYRKNYEYLDTVSGTNIYRNNSALPIAFISSKNVIGINTKNEDYFDLHNDMWSGIYGREEKILIQESNYSVSTSNLSESFDENGNTVYTKINEAIPAYVEYEFNASHNYPLYYYFTSPQAQDAKIIVNGEDSGQYFFLYRWDMSFADIFEKGEKINIRVVLNKNSLTISSPYFYYEDLELLSRLSSEIKARPLEFEQLSSSSFSGSFTGQEDNLLFFTIPYSEGWTLKVDGEKTELIKIMDAFMAAEISGGEHSFELNYLPQGIEAASILSISTAALGLLCLILDKKRKKTK